ncbi:MULTISPECIES: phosphoglycerate dehydrogenase [Leptospira]|uniref:Glyoxylate reductase n=2 Tax=Leptospira borgpetersenii TaxID=174 RepID=A0AAV3J7G2_LEPBO|nr:MULTISPECIES: phosphoglycerate dehydrogenase [Leptospira]EMO07739.1 putative glyoxylate reductase [Leptospira borgpetersenii str. Noumea 25]AXX16220.1 dehydrogenase [Leptospira borgpetersenii serovar Ceylonica]EKQ90133.1 putative glyoxylate reductase [Leptospira borgpetersenii str. UI 09149]EKR00569.1 putative glyoxylate reductase [Leptospira borgpetersenii serovar Castellonis str. 200801910]EMK08800.1 putative glyoxylate reductase [Leptospira sp. serovar Kenya str. Sh9]
MNNKIFISTYPFGIYDPEPLNLLNATGWEIITNPFKRKLKSAEVAEIAKDVNGIIAGTEDLIPLIQSNQKLKFISRVGIGLDSVPLSLCREREIRVSYTPDAVTKAVVELTVGLMLSVTRYISNADRELRKGEWSRFTGKRLGESVIGLIGLGRVGLSVLKILSAFAPKKILINDLMDKSNEVKNILEESKVSFAFVDKEQIYTASDVISIHVPLTKLTKNLISSAELSKFKKDAFLINTARGGIVNEAALYDALKNQRIAGAAIDVFEEEPYKGNLCKLENVLLTQHMGSCSYDCRLLMEKGAAEEIIRFFKGEPLLNEVPEQEYLNQS